MQSAKDKLKEALKSKKYCEIFKDLDDTATKTLLSNECPNIYHVPIKTPRLIEKKNI